MGKLTKVIKKKVKQLHDGYVKLTESRRGDKRCKDSDITGLYQANNDGLYERLDLAPETDSSSSNYSVSSNSTQSSPLPCSSRHQSRDSPQRTSNDTLDDSSSNNSSDSGVSGTPLKSSKQLKKLQFSSNSDEIRFFEKNTLERRSYRRKVCLNLNNINAELHKTKVYHVATLAKAVIVDRNCNEDSKDINYPNNETVTITTKLNKDFSNKDTSAYEAELNNNCLQNNLLNSLRKTPPAKPPRSAQRIARSSERHSQINYNLLNNIGVNEFESQRNMDEKKSWLDRDGYSIPFDVKEEAYYDKLLITPKKEKSRITKEPVYAQITPRSSRDLENIFDQANNNTESVYTEITPRSSKNIELYLSPIDIHAPTPKRLTQHSQSKNPIELDRDFPNLHSSFIPDANSTTEREFFSKKTKESLNLIHKTNWSLNKDEVLQGHSCFEKNRTPNNPKIEGKFVVNAFESRPSRRWEKHMRDLQREQREDEFTRNITKRRSLDVRKKTNEDLGENIKIIKNSFDDIEIKIATLEKEYKSLEAASQKVKQGIKKLKESPATSNSELQVEDLLDPEPTITIPDQLAKYRALRKARDIHCIRMAQASRALEEIKMLRGRSDWLEVLVAERVLLETSESVKLLTQQIRDTTYTIIPEPPFYTGSIRLSDIKFPFAKQFREHIRIDKHFTEFFVLTLSYGSQVYVSEFITGEAEPLAFGKSHSFNNVGPDFEIKVKLFCLKLRTSDIHFWEKFICYNLCPTSKIIYDDLLTQQLQEKTVLQTSFKLCAETILNRNHINEVSGKLSTKKESFPKLDDEMNFNLKCEDIGIMTEMSGFLDVGTVCGDTYYWEKKWCVLNGTNLLLYNYPQDEDFGKPFEQINLEYCFGPIITKVDNCPKRRSFQLKTGRPIMNSSQENKSLKTKPNFSLRKFFFAASNIEEYIRWTTEVTKILSSLRDFKQLAFGDEYYEYLGS